MSVTSAQQSFKPLSEYVQDHDILNDNAAMTYALQRCSAAYNTAQALIYEQDKETSDTHFETSIILGNLAVMLHAEIKNMDMAKAEKEVADLIKAKVNIYMNDAKANYIKTGSYMMDTYMEDDLMFCKKLSEALGEALAK